MKYVCALITVDDVARARRFYEGTLGQVVESDFGENVAFKGGFAIHQKDHFQGLLDGREIGSKANDAELYFEHDDVNGLAGRLAADGVEFLHGPREQPWRQLVTRFYDPDGHIVEVGERLEHVAYRLSDEGLNLDDICRVTYLSRPAALRAIAEYSSRPRVDAVSYPLADSDRELAARALAGDASAAEELLLGVQSRVFNLALRYLGNPEDARDACQDICLKAWKGLGSFRGDALFSTWVLAIAANHLKTVKKSRMESMGVSFEAYEAEAGAVPASPYAGPDEGLLTDELKHSCSLGMLQCLGRTDRLVYVLYAFFRVSSADGGLICGLGPAAYRQRLSRTRKTMASFMTGVYGLASEGAACRCRDRVGHALRQGRIGRERLFFSTHAEARAAAALTESMERLDAASAVFRGGPDFRHPDGPADVRRIIAGAAPAIVDA
ncbi:MAG: hypothetical protein CVV47_11430 [Spirochaetae bacterium HGW-Spirochaetae-3]|nr:MAG: hypothetical protein CVV47_11430 [Spirochaetae bacterium HGW-Spirochaetae-3]